MQDSRFPPLGRRGDDKLDEYLRSLYQIPYQLKSGSVNVNGLITNAVFNNIEPGKTYKYTWWTTVFGSGTFNANVSYNVGSNIDNFRISDPNGQGGSYVSMCRIINPTVTSLEPTFSITDAGAGIGYFVILEELPLHIATTKWT